MDHKSVQTVPKRNNKNRGRSNKGNKRNPVGIYIVLIALLVVICGSLVISRILDKKEQQRIADEESRRQAETAAAIQREEEERNARAQAEAENKSCACGRAILFVSATCPNCKLAISMLEKAGFLFKKVLATDNPELTNQYGVKQAPTLVVLGQNPGEFTKFKGVSEIKGMLTAKQVG